MNLKAYISGYQKQAAPVDNVDLLAQYVVQKTKDPSQETAKVQKSLEKYYKNPRVRLAGLSIPAGVAAGTVLGGLGGHLYNGNDNVKDELKHILIGSGMGALGGGLAGSMVKDRLKWPVVQELVKELTKNYTDNNMTLGDALKKALHNMVY